MGKPAAERQRDSRERKKLGLQNRSKVCKTLAERQSEFRKRKKLLEETMDGGKENKPPKPGRERMAECRLRKSKLYTSEDGKNRSWLHRYFNTKFYNEQLDSVCDVCDRIWWTGDTVKNNVQRVKSLLVSNGYPDQDQYNLCRTCTVPLMKNKIPQLATSNGFYYPPIPDELPDLDPITERLVSPRLPFLQIRELNYFSGAKKLVGRVINVPVDVNEMVCKLPRNLSDDMVINVHLKKHVLQKSAFYKGYVQIGVVRRWLQYLVETPLYKMHNITINDAFLENSVVHELHTKNEDIDGAAINVITPQVEARIEGEGAMSLQQKTMLWDDSFVLTMAPGQNQRPNPLSFDEFAEELSFPSIYYGHPRLYKERVTPFMMVTSEMRRRDRRGVVPEKILYSAAKIMRLRVIDGFRHMFRNKREVIQGITREQMLNPEFIQESLDRNMAFMQGIPNSMQYWRGRKKDLFAMMRQLGKPTLFLTLSASEVHWPNLLKTLIKAKRGQNFSNSDGVTENMSDDDLLNMSSYWKAEIVNNDPVTCDLYFSRMVATFMSALKSPSGPFGKYRVKDYFRRIEFQHRGSAHCHILLWLDNVPNEPRSEDMPETVNMIDTLMTTVGEALKSHRSFQTHRHTHTCYKKTAKRQCRFGAPFWPMKTTKILFPAVSKNQALESRFKSIHAMLEAQNVSGDVYESIQEFMSDNMLETEDEYLEILRNGIQRPTVFLKRWPADLMTNSFNADIAEVLQSNMDLQFILDEYSCAAYVAEYVNKSDRGFSSLHRELIALRDQFPDQDYEGLVKEVGKRALSNIEMSSQEAAWFLLRLPMSQCSRQVRYIPTQHPSERMVTRKTNAQMNRENTPMDSTNVWNKNPIQHYECRPEQLENVCLADYVSEYNSYNNDTVEGNEDDELYFEDDESNKEMSTSTNCNLAKKRRFSAVIRYMNYDASRNPLNYKRECVTLFHPFRNEELEVLNDDAYLRIFEAEQERLLAARKRYESGLDLIKITELIRQTRKVDEAEEEGEESSPYEENGKRSRDLEDYSGFDEEADTDINIISVNSMVRKVNTVVSHVKFCELMRSLNDEQRELLLEIIYRLVYAPELGPLQIFFTGPAGSGKSYVLRTSMEAINRFARRHDCTKNAFVACATTGKAAVNIDGVTAHSVFKLSFNTKSHGSLSAEKLQTMRCDFREVKYIIIDEISMASSDMLRSIDGRLRALSCCNMPFGGFNVILCGDIRQLPPVNASPPYARPANLLQANMVWQNLSYYPLHTVVRQADKSFSTILTSIGTGVRLTRKQKALIESRFHNAEELEPLHDAVRIFLDNKSVDNYNYRVLNVEGSVAVPAEDLITGYAIDSQRLSVKKKLDSMDVSKTGNMCGRLLLVLNRPYMVTQNINLEDRIVNGSIGFLRYIEYDRNEEGDLTDTIKRLWIEFTNQTTGKILRLKFRHYAKHWGLHESWTPIARREVLVDVNSKLIRVRRKQFPVVPACAITVHKSQGATYDRVVYEYQKIHRTSLTYVAMSRAKTLEGLYLTNSKGDHTFYHAAGSDNTMLKTELRRLETKQLNTVVKEAKRFVLNSIVDIGYLNVQSLNAHSSDLVSDEILRRNQVLAMSETWMDNDKDAVEIPGFRCVARNKRPNIKAGGVAIYESLVSRLTNFTPVTNDYFVNEHGDICCAVMEFEGRKVALVCVYASNGTSFADMCALMDCALWRFDKENARLSISKRHELDKCPVVLCGDLNYDMKKPEGQKLLQYVEEAHGVKLAIDNSISTTRNGSCIDYVFTKGVDDLSTFPYVSYFSTHRPIVCSIGSTSSQH